MTWTRQETAKTEPFELIRGSRLCANMQSPLTCSCKRPCCDQCGACSQCGCDHDGTSVEEKLVNGCWVGLCHLMWQRLVKQRRLQWREGSACLGRAKQWMNMCMGPTTSQRTWRTLWTCFRPAWTTLVTRKVHLPCWKSFAIDIWAGTVCRVRVRSLQQFHRCSRNRSEGHRCNLPQQGASLKCTLKKFVVCSIRNQVWSQRNASINSNWCTRMIRAISHLISPPLANSRARYRPPNLPERSLECPNEWHW